MWRVQIPARADENRAVAVASEMSELAGGRNGLVQILIRSVFPNGDELRFIRGNVQVQNGASIRRPERGTDGAIRRGFESAILLAVEVDQPQPFVAEAWRAGDAKLTQRRSKM